MEEEKQREAALYFVSISWIDELFDSAMYWWA
jgi:hypothetical protein